MKQKVLLSLTELEHLNPKIIRDYCYSHSAPAEFRRGMIRNRDLQRGIVPYHCRSCDKIAYYNLIKEVRKP